LLPWQQDVRYPAQNCFFSLNVCGKRLSVPVQLFHSILNYLYGLTIPWLSLHSPQILQKRTHTGSKKLLLTFMKIKYYFGTGYCQTLPQVWQPRHEAAMLARAASLAYYKSLTQPAAASSPAQHPLQQPQHRHGSSSNPRNGFSSTSSSRDGRVVMNSSGSTRGFSQSMSNDQTVRRGRGGSSQGISSSSRGAHVPPSMHTQLQRLLTLLSSGVDNCLFVCPCVPVCVHVAVHS
jgi:hypothetical protein